MIERLRVGTQECGTDVWVVGCEGLLTERDGTAISEHLDGRGVDPDGQLDHLIAQLQGRGALKSVRSAKEVFVTPERSTDKMPSS